MTYCSWPSVLRRPQPSHTAWLFVSPWSRLEWQRYPKEPEYLRVFLAELERFRHHLGVIAGICNSTGLAVADSQAAILEEEALRLSVSLPGTVIFSVWPVPGGLSCDLSDEACLKAVHQARAILNRLNELEQMLRFSNSFLDRIEKVGIVTADQARSHGLVGPVARGSGYCYDLRRMQPYSAYNRFDFDVPCEQEGDGYARLRVWFAEARQSVSIMEQVARQITGRSNLCSLREETRGSPQWRRSSAGCNLSLGTDRRERKNITISPDYTFLFQLAWVPSGSRKFCFPGFPDYSGYFRALRGRK